MADTGFKVHIQFNPASGGVDIYVILNTFDGRKLAEPVELNFKTVEPGAEHSPTLRLDMDMANELLISVAEALDAHGTKTDKDSKIEGKLIVMQGWLNDLRYLLKLPLKGDF